MEINTISFEEELVGRRVSCEEVLRDPAILDVLIGEMDKKTSLLRQWRFTLREMRSILQEIEQKKRSIRMMQFQNEEGVKNIRDMFEDTAAMELAIIWLGESRQC